MSSSWDISFFLNLFMDRPFLVQLVDMQSQVHRGEIDVLQEKIGN